MVRYRLFDRSNRLNSFHGVPRFFVPERTKRHKEKPAEAPAEFSRKIQLIVVHLSRAEQTDRVTATREACWDETARRRVIIEHMNDLWQVQPVFSPGDVVDSRFDLNTPRLATVAGLALVMTVSATSRSSSSSPASRASTWRRSFCELGARPAGAPVVCRQLMASCHRWVQGHDSAADCLCGSLVGQDPVEDEGLAAVDAWTLPIDTVLCSELLMPFCVFCERQNSHNSINLSVESPGRV